MISAAVASGTGRTMALPISGGSKQHPSAAACLSLITAHGPATALCAASASDSGSGLARAFARRPAASAPIAAARPLLCRRRQVCGSAEVAACLPVTTPPSHVEGAENVSRRTSPIAAIEIVGFFVCGRAANCGGRQEAAEVAGPSRERASGRRRGKARGPHAPASGAKASHRRPRSEPIGVYEVVRFGHGRPRFKLSGRRAHDAGLALGRDATCATAFEGCEDMIRMVFDHIIVDMAPLRTALWTRLNVNIRHFLPSLGTLCWE